MGYNEDAYFPPKWGFPQWFHFKHQSRLGLWNSKNRGMDTLSEGRFLFVSRCKHRFVFLCRSLRRRFVPSRHFQRVGGRFGQAQGTATVLLRVLLLLLLFPDDVTYTIRVLREWSIRFCRWTLGERKNVYRLWTWVERAQTLFLPLTSLLPLLTREITVEHNKRCVLDKFQKSVPSPFVVFVHETLH